MWRSALRLPEVRKCLLRLAPRQLLLLWGLLVRGFQLGLGCSKVMTGLVWVEQRSAWDRWANESGVLRSARVWRLGRKSVRLALELLLQLRADSLRLRLVRIPLPGRSL